MIEIERLEKTFTQPGGERVPALRGVDVIIPTGQFVTVIGTNGSGKSTLLNAVAGSFFPDAGSIRIDGIDVTNKPEYKRAALIGRVFQDPFKGTCPSMSVAENLRMAELRGQRRGLRVGLSRSSLERMAEAARGDSECGSMATLKGQISTSMVHACGRQVIRTEEAENNLSTMARTAWSRDRGSLDTIVQIDLFEAREGYYRSGLLSCAIPLSLRLPKNRLPDWSASRFLRSYAFLTRIGRIWGG